GIGESRHSEIIIKNLHQLARDLNLTTIACGVEHKYQYEFLSDLGCEQMQGFYFYSPGKIGRMKKAKLFIADEKKF
ncbi:MAG TPA: EAL domain-containing protein, partial [Thiotrichales bacterium]|nr:EAL domain-containing protein [Thiotrichales bacterium]